MILSNHVNCNSFHLVSLAWWDVANLAIEATIMPSDIYTCPTISRKYFGSLIYSFLIALVTISKSLIFDSLRNLHDFYEYCLLCRSKREIGCLSFHTGCKIALFHKSQCSNANRILNFWKNIFCQLIVIKDQ